MYLFGKATATGMKDNNKKGFTLIEVLIALAVFSVISVTIFASFRSYGAVIKRERDMAMESVRIQRSIKTVEDYVRLSTQDVEIGKVVRTNRTIFTFRDMNPSARRDEHNLNIILTNDGQLYSVKNPTLVGDASGDRQELLSPRISKFSARIEDGALLVEVKSGVIGLREMKKYIQIRGQFRNR